MVDESAYVIVEQLSRLCGHFEAKYDGKLEQRSFQPNLVGVAQVNVEH